MSKPKPLRIEANWLHQQIITLRGRLFLIVIGSVCIGLLIACQAYLLATACQRLIIEKSDFASIQILLFWFLLLTISRVASSAAVENQAIFIAARCKQAVRNQLYRKILSLGSSGLANHEPATLAETVTKAVDELDPYITRFLPQAIQAVILPVMFLLFVLPAEWRAGIVLLFSAPFIPLFMVLIGHGSQLVHRRLWQKLSFMSNHFLDLVRGLPDLIIFNAIKQQAVAVADISEKYRKASMAVLRIAFLSALALEFFSTAGTAVVAVIVGFRLLWGELSLQHGLFVLLLAPEFYLPLRNLGLAHHARQQGISAAEQIINILNLQPDKISQGTEAVPAGELEIIFQQVSYSYNGQRGGVQQLDLTLPANSITAICGASGAGKTTLARLLAKLLQPDCGKILVNNIDLQEISTNDWHSQIAWVPQKPYFINASIRENLLFGASHIDDEQVMAALKTANAAQFVSGLPEGLSTVLGGRGAGLSGGELKRLALARALLRNTRLLILDEPTAGLDSKSEQQVCRAISQLRQKHTVLLISHRTETLTCADKVWEMAAGKIS